LRQTIEAQPPPGQIRPSEVRVACLKRARGDVAASGREMQEHDRVERGKTCAGVSTAAKCGFRSFTGNDLAAECVFLQN
jgi:hypothetical protein